MKEGSGVVIALGAVGLLLVAAGGAASAGGGGGTPGGYKPPPVDPTKPSPPAPPAGGGGGSQADLEFLQQDLNAIRAAIIAGQERLGRSSVYDPYPAIAQSGGGFERCTSAGELVEDGIDGPCTRNAERVYERVIAHVSSLSPLKASGATDDLSLVASEAENPLVQRWLAQGFLAWHATIAA